MKFACVLLILFTLLAVLHVHSNDGIDLSRPCPVCVAIHCAIVAAILVATASAATKPGPFAFEDFEPSSQLLVSDLFIRPPPFI